jgi:hypothetical protein
VHLGQRLPTIQSGLAFEQKRPDRTDYYQIAAAAVVVVVVVVVEEHC